MIIGILSDTQSLNLPAAMTEHFKSVDLIIHAGDICDLQTLKQLKVLAPVKAVQGNMDDAAVKKILPVKDIIECASFKIGLTHGHQGLGREALKNAMFSFKDDKIDVLIFGHSHQAINERVGDILYFNPGSPNDVVRAKFFSYGLISIEAGQIKAEILKI